MPVFFIQAKDVVDGMAKVQPPLLHHLSKSLRIRVGESLTFNDEQSRRYFTTVVDLQPTVLLARVERTIDRQSVEASPIILGQALMKGEKMSWVIQKATELGTATIAPLSTDHTIPRIRPESVSKQRERWERIALEAAQQSERWEPPIILPPQPLPEFLKTQTEEGNTIIVLAERQQKSLMKDLPLQKTSSTPVCLLIGPEGGWSQQEKELFKTQNCLFSSLGTRILRAETASLAALAILQARLENI